jgi:hypothetical protein
MYLLDNVKRKSGQGIWKWNGKKFVQINGRAKFLAVGVEGRPFAVRANGKVYWPGKSCKNPIKIKKIKIESD